MRLTNGFSEEEKEDQDVRKGCAEFKNEITTLYLKVSSLAQYYLNYDHRCLDSSAAVGISDHEISSGLW